MAEENEAAQTSVDGQIRVRWDSSNMTSSYANVCNVSSTREELTLLFGTNQTWDSADSEVTVQLHNRIVLNPYAAKRLSILLGNVVEEYEKRFGKLDIEAAGTNQS